VQGSGRATSSSSACWWGCGGRRPAPWTPPFRPTCARWCWRWSVGGSDADSPGAGGRGASLGGPNLFFGYHGFMTIMPTKSTPMQAKAAGRAGARSTAADDPLAASRVRVLVDAFGGAQLAKLIGVSASQPTRWVKGQERPGIAAAPLLIDLEHVLAKARLIWGEEAAKLWLCSANSYLEGAAAGRASSPRPLGGARCPGGGNVGRGRLNARLPGVSLPRGRQGR